MTDFEKQIEIEAEENRKSRGIVACAVVYETGYAGGAHKAREILSGMGESKQDCLSVVEEWQFYWMNQKQNSQQDYENYHRRAFGVDANMRHDIARRFAPIIQAQREKIKELESKVTGGALARSIVGFPLPGDDAKIDFIALAKERDKLAERVKELESNLENARWAKKQWADQASMQKQRILDLEAQNKILREAVEHTIQALQDQVDMMTPTNFKGFIAKGILQLTLEKQIENLKAAVGDGGYGE